MERAIEVFVAVYGLAIGLSHVAQPRAWVEFFVRLRGWGRAGVFVNGFLTLTFGAFIVAFHNVWAGLPVVVTLLGWSQVAKGLSNFVVPQVGLRAMARVSPERAKEFVVAGVVLLALSAVSGYAALAR